MLENSSAGQLVAIAGVVAAVGISLTLWLTLDTADVPPPDRFEVMAKTVDEQSRAVQGLFDRYAEATGVMARLSVSDLNVFELELQRRVGRGDPPAVAFIPQPGAICGFADHLVSIEEMGFDLDALRARHSASWIELGRCADGNHYGIPLSSNVKSLIYYHQPTFEEMGYQVPSTYGGLVTLSRDIVADGLTPWCLGWSDGASSGWPGTDWVEEILARQAGLDAYEQWYKHEIAFNDEIVVDAFEQLERLLDDAEVWGGRASINEILVIDSSGPLFDEPPGCLMVKQGSFAASFFARSSSYEHDEDLREIDTFAFPSINGRDVTLGGGDTIIVFDRSRHVVDAVRDWVSAEWQCTLASATGGGIAAHGGHGIAGVEYLPGNSETDVACFESAASRRFAAQVTRALADDTFMFDASDLMPPEIGQDRFWRAMLEWNNGADLNKVLADVEQSWPA